MLTTGRQNGVQDTMGSGTNEGPIASIGIVVDDCGPQSPLGLVVGSGEVVHIREAQHKGVVFAHAPGELPGIFNSRPVPAGLSASGIDISG
jgi:hypothetical protein